MFNLKFWHLLGGAGFLLLFLIFLFLSSDISISSVDETDPVGLDQRIIYLGEGDLCGISNSKCKPGLICQKEIESDLSGGTCVKPENVSGPFNVRPEVPEYNPEDYNNWN